MIVLQRLRYHPNVLYNCHLMEIKGGATVMYSGEMSEHSSCVAIIFIECSRFMCPVQRFLTIILVLKNHTYLWPQRELRLEKLFLACRSRSRSHGYWLWFHLYKSPMNFKVDDRQTLQEQQTLIIGVAYKGDSSFKKKSPVRTSLNFAPV